jgi:mono/diheme cytochrome c family protein
MKRISILAFVCLSVWACLGEPGSDEAAANGSEKEIDGKEIYEHYCILCHGADGKMAVGGAFDLTETQLSLEERIELIREGRNTMTPFGGLLSEEEIKAVAEYSISRFQSE